MVVDRSMDQIGRCKGCDKAAKLDDGVCKDCLENPKRGRDWAEMSHLCRTEPEYAFAIYARIRTARGREIFVQAYGLPPGAERIARPQLSLVNRLN
jgi:hypothetical protein